MYFGSRPEHSNSIVWPCLVSIVIFFGLFGTEFRIEVLLAFKKSLVDADLRSIPFIFGTAGFLSDERHLWVWLTDFCSLLCLENLHELGETSKSEGSTEWHRLSLKHLTFFFKNSLGFGFATFAGPIVLQALRCADRSLKMTSLNWEQYLSNGCSVQNIIYLFGWAGFFSSFDIRLYIDSRIGSENVQQLELFKLQNSLIDNLRRPGRWAIAAITVLLPSIRDTNSNASSQQRET